MKAASCAFADPLSNGDAGLVWTLANRSGCTESRGMSPLCA